MFSTCKHFLLERVWLFDIVSLAAGSDSSIRNTLAAITEGKPVVYDFAELAGIARAVVLVSFFTDLVRVSCVFTWNVLHLCCLFI